MMCFMGQLHMLLQLFSILLAFIIALKMFSFPPDEQPRNFTTMKQIKKKTKVTHVPMTHDILLLVFSLWFLPILIHPQGASLSPRAVRLTRVFSVCLSPSCLTNPSLLSGISLNLSVPAPDCLPEGPCLFFTYQ